MSDLKLVVNHEEKSAFVIHPTDNVAVALIELNAGEFCTVRIGDQFIKMQVIEDIPFGHKFSLKPLTENESVYKYGEEIGKMINSVEMGSWIHTHNMYCERGKGNGR